MRVKPVHVEVYAGGLKLDFGGDYLIGEGERLTIDLGDSLPAVLNINGRPTLVNVDGDWHLIGRRVLSAAELRGER